MQRPTAPQTRHDDRFEGARRRRFLASGAALIGSALARPALAGPGIVVPRRAEVPGPSVSVDRDGDTLVVHAQTDVAASAALVFATLADYDRLAEFIPDVTSSRTLERHGASALVEQRGRAAFGPFEQWFTLRMAIEEAPGAWIRATAAGGDFKRFDARYELTTVGESATRIDYVAMLEPTAGVPPLVGVPLMRGLIRRQFAAMVDEITRRATA